MTTDNFTIIDIPEDGNSQFAAIGWYTNESADIVRSNIVEELISYKEEYIHLINESCCYDTYINKISKENSNGDNTTLIAASQFYKINICINDTIKLFVDNTKPIDLYLENKNNHYNVKIKYENTIEEDTVEEDIIEDIIEDTVEEDIIIEDTVVEDIEDTVVEDTVVEDIIEDTVEESDVKLITVFDDPVNFNCKHPLNSKWTLWVDNKENAKSKIWLESIKKIITVDSVEDFWGVFNNIPAASYLNFPSDYYLFKDDTLPMWEDTKNKNGGKMTISLKKTIDADFLDKLWLYSVLGSIGEQFYDGNVICGVVLNIRKHQDRINIWVSTSEKDEVIAIANRWKELLEIQRTRMQVSFIKHDDPEINYII